MLPSFDELTVDQATAAFDMGAPGVAYVTENVGDQTGQSSGQSPDADGVGHCLLMAIHNLDGQCSGCSQSLPTN